MKMKFPTVFKIFLIGLCGIGLLVTFFSFPSVKNVWALDMEDLMESIQESIQEDVKQTNKQQARQQTMEAITENIVEPAVAESGTATTTTDTGTDTGSGGTGFNPVTSSGVNVTGSWLIQEAPTQTFQFNSDGTCSFNDSQDGATGNGTYAINDNGITLNLTLSNGSPINGSGTVTGQNSMQINLGGGLSNLTRV